MIVYFASYNDGRHKDHVPIGIFSSLEKFEEYIGWDKSLDEVKK